MKTTLTILAFISASFACFPQDISPEIKFIEEINWTIQVPEGFDVIELEEFEKIREKGKKAIEDTFGAKPEDSTKVILSLRNGQFNILEVNYQPNFTPKNEDYTSTLRETKLLIYEMFTDQMPGIIPDTSSTVEYIDKLTFYVYHVTLGLPEKRSFKIHMYMRLFDDKDWTFNIMYMDEEKGQEMLEAFRNSTFD